MSDEKSVSWIADRLMVRARVIAALLDEQDWDGQAVPIRRVRNLVHHSCDSFSESMKLHKIVTHAMINQSIAHLAGLGCIILIQGDLDECLIAHPNRRYAWMAFADSKGSG